MGFLAYWRGGPWATLEYKSSRVFLGQAHMDCICLRFHVVWGNERRERCLQGREAIENVPTCQVHRVQWSVRLGDGFCVICHRSLGSSGEESVTLLGKKAKHPSGVS